MSFPNNFTWGVATASYQIEGSPVRAGGGKSVWDMFCERKDAIANADTGFVACDHVEHYREDVSLMRQTGIKAYRLSISWPRVLPEGVGRVNEQGLGFYDKLIDELLGAGIDPWVTLFHWDYPYDLYNCGGWLNPDSSRWFADYARVVVDRLSDRVRHWMTLNEPQCFIGLGHLTGYHAPGDKLQISQVLIAAHNALLAHGRAVQVIRSAAKHPQTEIGFAPVGVTAVPATENAADIEAAKSEMFSVRDPGAVWHNTWWMDPIFKGVYPDDGLETYGKNAPKPAPGDMELIAQPLDFFGVNIYEGKLYRAGADGKPELAPYPAGLGRTSFGWPVTPECLYWGPRFLWERYGKPIVVTENGLSNTDWVHVDGQVHDPQRVDFITRYLREFERSHVESGAEIRGYFLWSLLDNFEWAEGFRQRFGLVHVDYLTQRRTLKDSAHWYRRVIETNGAYLSCDEDA